VDIGCGIVLVKTDIDFKGREAELDRVIRQNVPFGFAIHEEVRNYDDFERMHCWTKLSAEAIRKARRSLGSLGGGNHFIEAYENGWLAIHSGSRNIGLSVAQYYQELAEAQNKNVAKLIRQEEMNKIEPAQRQSWLKQRPLVYETDLAYLTGQDRQDYLDDMNVMVRFAEANRRAMIDNIIGQMGGKVEELIQSTHNFISVCEGRYVLRKGATSARLGEILVIPLNMRDGMLVCRGKGNEDWNYSAPHGAGRLYSRSESRKRFDVGDFEKIMSGIWSSCIGPDTLDEAPFAYKDAEQIKRLIEPTAEIIRILKPIYNFKAGE
jgi:RNA-splicing ligase RtcB